MTFDTARAASEKYINLATFRKDGREVRTPVWIATAEDRIYVYTNVTSGKVKRIRGNAAVRVAPCTSRGHVTGDWIDGKARLVEDPAMKERAVRAFVDKYWVGMRIALLLSRLSGRIKQLAILELEL